MKITGKFYIVNELNDKIKIWFITALPIIWNRDGQFCIIPKEVVQNAMDLHEMHQHADLADLKVTVPIISIMWSQGIPISNLAGRALVGE